MIESPYSKILSVGVERGLLIPDSGEETYFGTLAGKKTVLK